MTALPAPMTSREIIAAVDRLDVTANAKLLLARLADTTVRVGDRVLVVGRYILSFVFEAMRRFPMTSFGLMIGIVLSLLIGSVALIGVMLATLLGPLMIALFEARMRVATGG